MEKQKIFLYIYSLFMAKKCLWNSFLYFYLIGKMISQKSDKIENIQLNILSSMNSSQNEEIARNQQEIKKLRQEKNEEKARNQQEIEKLRQEKNEEIEKLRQEKNEEIARYQVEIEKLKVQNKKDKLGFLQILEKL